MPCLLLVIVYLLELLCIIEKRHQNNTMWSSTSPIIPNKPTTKWFFDHRSQIKYLCVVFSSSAVIAFSEQFPFSAKFFSVVIVRLGLPIRPFHLRLVFSWFIYCFLDFFFVSFSFRFSFSYDFFAFRHSQRVFLCLLCVSYALSDLMLRKYATNLTSFAQFVCFSRSMSFDGRRKSIELLTVISTIMKHGQQQFSTSK